MHLFLKHFPFWLDQLVLGVILRPLSLSLLSTSDLLASISDLTSLLLWATSLSVSCRLKIKHLCVARPSGAFFFRLKPALKSRTPRARRREVKLPTSASVLTPVAELGSCQLLEETDGECYKPWVEPSAWDAALSDLYGWWYDSDAAVRIWWYSEDSDGIVRIVMV
jgi:hypothetical protein